MRLFGRHVNYYKNVFYIFVSPCIRMSKKSINFDNKNISKSNFYKNKELFKIDDIDVNKILVPKKRTISHKKVD